MQRWAVATGNANDPAIWDGGTLPAVGDNVFSNGFVVTITVNTQWASMTNDAGTTAIAGGSFVLNDDVTLTTNVFVGPTGFCLTYGGITSATVNGNTTGGDTAPGITVTSGTFTLNGTAYGSPTGRGVGITGNGTIPVRIRDAKHGAAGAAPTGGLVTFLDPAKATIEVRNTVLTSKILKTVIPAFAGFPLSRTVR